MYTPLASSVIYQLFLRPFTPEGTLKGAEKMLPHLRSLGVDIVYLCPINDSDPDADRAYWSRRMKTCGFDNPKNPYRIRDYYRIDPEYGSDEDLASFVAAAHALDMRVLLDVVYRHSGPTCALMREHPDYYRRNPDGTPVAPEYGFPCFDYDNPAVRVYFTGNREYYVARFGVDGFRADCGGGMDPEFWREAIARVRIIRPDALFLNEGVSRAHLEAGFDLDYGCTWCGELRRIARGEMDASELAACFARVASRMPEGKYGWRGLENHDFCNDSWEDRLEKAVGPELFECALVLNFTGDGIPYLYCGNEIGDVTRHSILANRFVAPNLRINWSNALTPRAQARMELICRLSELRHGHPALAAGRPIEYLCGPREALAYRRANGGEELLVCANLSDKPLVFPLDGRPLEPLLTRQAQCGAQALSLAPYGFCVCALR